LFEFRYDGLGIDKGGSGVTSADGKLLTSTLLPPFLLTVCETLDLGVDLRAPLDEHDYQVPFRLARKLAKVTIKWTPEAVSAEDRKHWNEAARRISLAAE
jgi:arylsulfatase